MIFLWETDFTYYFSLLKQLTNYENITVVLNQNFWNTMCNTHRLLVFLFDRLFKVGVFIRMANTLEVPEFNWRICLPGTTALWRKGPRLRSRRAEMICVENVRARRYEVGGISYLCAYINSAWNFRSRSLMSMVFVRASLKYHAEICIFF